ncbi:unnamed protein product [Chironomus riparius]|uniref:PH domain-containing protein n=1 Tax=Chironomus riparius TaxID=315576 RepID=A0A9N9WU64_9DIPT|nr:unnamed protein product [Chironomus riparius]
MEIIKQGFLNLNGKKVFTIFCMRNEPLFEIYAKKIHASHASHLHVLELKRTKYVGLRIPRNISESSHEFIIVLDNDVFSFSCKRWDLMNDWVNCLKTKLRELKVLSPKENIYTKTPAMRPILQMTRNPRDPLPECPPIESDERIPGLEVQQSTTTTSQSRTASIISTEPVSENENTQIESITFESFTVSSNNMNISINNNNEDDSEQQAISIPIFNFATSNTSSQNLINLLSNPLCRYTSNNSDLQFANSFDYDEEEFDEDEEYDQSEKEPLINVLPTSLNIEYNHNLAEDVTNISDNNITIIPIESNEINNEIISKVDESKVTKIKIAVEYDHLCKALSSHTINSNQNGSEETVVINNSVNIISNQSIPSTSSFIKKLNNNINIIEKESAKSVPNTPKKMPIATAASTSNTPKHEKRKLSLREQQVLQLRHEINTEIRFKLRKKDCVDAIAFASYNGQLWISGFKPNPQLYVFHIGDQLLAINNIANIKSPADAQKFIKMCAGLFVEVTIKRLPLAGIFIVKRDFENQCLGLLRDGSSLLDIVPNSIASRSGIPSRPYTSHDDDSIFWIITEINFRPLSLISHKKYDETELLLNSVGLETSLLLQPSDFIAKIKKELKAMKNYRDYTLQ